MKTRSMKTLTCILSCCLAAAAVSLSGCPMAVQSSDRTVSTVTESGPSARKTKPADAGPAAVESSADTAPADQLAAAEPAAQEKPTEKPATKPADAAPSTRPKADRTPRKPGDPIRITFDHIIIGMQADVAFRPWMLNDNEEVKELEGKKVSITGVMHGGSVNKEKNIKWFILLRNAECKYGPGGQADHLAEVELKQPFTFTSKTVRVEGTLRIIPKNGDDGNTLSLYTIEDAVATEQK
jgi:hypothetical protein